jgi:cytochrome bd-type quinol oxidase subunit 2
MILSSVVYILGALVSLACALLLLRGYRRGRKRLLLWSGLCFAMLTISNGLVFVDFIVLPEIDLTLWRLATSAMALVLLLFGLIWESDR